MVVMRALLALVMAGLTASAAAAQPSGEDAPATGGLPARSPSTGSGTGTSMFPMDALRLIVHVPAAAGRWSLDPTLSKPGQAALFNDDTTMMVVDETGDRSCKVLLQGMARELSGAVVDRAPYGFGADWYPDGAFVSATQDARDSLMICRERAGRKLVVVFVTYPRATASRERAARFADAISTAWTELADGVQTVSVDGQPITIRDRRAVWAVQDDGVLVRAFGDPGLVVQLSRDQIGTITASPTEPCASWTKALGGGPFTPIAPSYLSGSWHGEAVASISATSSVVFACLPRKDGGNLLAQLGYQGDATAADFADAVRPLLAAIAAAIGVAPAPVSTPPSVPAPAVADPGSPPYVAPYGSSYDDDDDGPRRSSYEAAMAPTLTLSYARLTPSQAGAELVGGATAAIDVPVFAFGGGIVKDVGIALGYHGTAGWSIDGRAGVGYQLGRQTALIPVLGLGFDMLDHGDDAAPFRASLAGYGYAAAIIRTMVGDDVVIEARAATVRRGGVLDETLLSGRATYLRGSRRKLSLELSWRRFEHEHDDALGAELVGIGVGIGG